mgnify:FL=1
MTPRFQEDMWKFVIRVEDERVKVDKDEETTYHVFVPRLSGEFKRELIWQKMALNQMSLLHGWANVVKMARDWEQEGADEEWLGRPSAGAVAAPNKPTATNAPKPGQLTAGGKPVSFGGERKL